MSTTIFLDDDGVTVRQSLHPRTDACAPYACVTVDARHGHVVLHSPGVETLRRIAATCLAAADALEAVQAQQPSDSAEPTP